MRSVTSHNPMKKTSKSLFFDGSITDGKTSMRIYGFDTNVRKQLADFEQAPLVIGNYEVKRFRMEPHELEVFVPSRTELHNNDKAYSIDKDTIRHDTVGRSFFEGYKFRISLISFAKI